MIALVLAARRALPALAAVAIASAVALPFAARADEPVLTLADAYRLALRNNESFRIGDEAVERARLAYDKALALLLPTLRIAGNYTFNDTELVIDLGIRKITLQQKNLIAGLGSFNMTLFDARSIPALRQTKIASKVVQEQTAFSQQDVLYEVTRAYIAVLAAQRLVEVNRESLRVQEEHLRDATAQAKAGTALKLAVTRAEIEVVRARRELVRAQSSYDSSWVALRYLLGAPVRGRLVRPGAPTLPSTTADGLVAEAQRSRRDLRALREDIDNAKQAIQVSYGAFYPTLGMVATSNVAPATGLAARVLNSQTVFTLGWTLFDGGTRYADLKEKHSLLREAILKHAQLGRSIERDVRSALLDLRTAEAALDTSRRELELARENHAMVMARFRAGLATTIEAVDAATQLVTADVGVLREELNVDTVRVNLLRSVGAEPISAMVGSAAGIRQEGLAAPRPNPFDAPVLPVLTRGMP